MSACSSRRWVGIAVVVMAGTTTWITLGPSLRGNRAYEPVPLGFNGTSDQLLRTVVVPTLDTAIPEGKNAVWCASFQFAWNRLKDDVAGEPIQLTNAQPIADRLNRSDQTEKDVEPESVYAAVGFAKDGIVERIQAEMARRFPDCSKPELDVPPDGAVAYAFLAATCKFDIPFFENDLPFLFKDSAGGETAVGSFGIRPKEAYAYHQLRQQVRILFSSRARMHGTRSVQEFVVDLCETSRPDQIVLARVDRESTLAETLAGVEKKIAEFSSDDSRSRLGPSDSLLVPSMAWRVTHRFKEIEGSDKHFLNPPLRGRNLDAALQTIQFRLDRSGAELSSESKVVVRSGPSLYLADRPFLLYMKKRGGQQPFLVLWIENAELLQGK
jgi:hypothetical protein